VSEAAVQSSLDAIHLHGGQGVIRETGVQRALLDAIPSRIFSGTTEIQRDIVAKKMGL
jgi:alkylation response protein AidB-like acyl-CoA dehydrogenase